MRPQPRSAPLLYVLVLAWFLAGCYVTLDIGVDPPEQSADDDDDDSQDESGPDDDDTTRPEDGQTDDDDVTDPPPDDDDTTLPADDDDVTDPPPDDDDDDDATPPDTGDSYCYWEETDPTASLSDLEASYSSWDWEPVVLEVTDRRYPSGNMLLTLTQADPWWDAFTDPSTFGTLMDSLMTMHHEQTHYWDYDHALFEVYFGYFINSDWQPQPTFYAGFPRSEILPMLVDSSTSLYSGTYLVGDQGTYGFMELLDELNCYINGLAGIALVGEFLPWGTSARDGAVAFMYYLELYLQRARLSYPSLYSQICGDPEMQDLILVQWLRMHFFLQISDTFPSLGIYDTAIEANLYDPGNQSEIELCTGHVVQQDHCLTPGDSWVQPW